MKNLYSIAIASVAALTLVACGQAPTSKENTSETTAAELVASHSAAANMKIISSGSFEGRSKHITTGGVSVRQAEDGYYVILDEDFNLDGAPDPVLGFGNGEYIVEAQFSALNTKTGFQSYKLPEGLNPTDFDQVYVWCKQFGVPLGVASLEG